ncbi:MAG: MFS transporter [Pseudobdellovibrio sp.]
MKNKKIASWALYDFANSVFFTTVMAGFFPVFFKQYWSTGVSATSSTERLGWILSVSGFLLAILSPTLGVISDKRRSKKKFLFITMCLGVMATIGLYFVPEGGWSQAAFLYGFGLFMCSASCVFYDSLMTSVASEDQYDFVSSLGYSLGYLGGGILFLLNVIMYLKPELFGISSPVQAVKISFITVGIWWFVFTLPLMKNVPEPETKVSNKHFIKLTIETLEEIKQTALDIFKNKNLLFFVVAYWLYIDGVFTVMSMAVDFGMSLGFKSSDLIVALLITQFIGFPAAYLFGIAAKKWHNKNLILACLVIYGVAIIGASHMTNETHFFILAATVGLSQGGVQALSRSLFAQLSPPEKSGEYFGFFNLLGKFASVLGPALMAIFAKTTGDSRQTILSLLILICAGGFFLVKVKRPNV